VSQSIEFKADPVQRAKEAVQAIARDLHKGKGVQMEIEPLLVSLVRFAHQKSPSALATCLVDLANLVHLMVLLQGRAAFLQLIAEQKAKIKKTMFDTTVDLFVML
jgi:hypothetical protein